MSEFATVRSLYYYDSAIDAHKMQYANTYTTCTWCNKVKHVTIFGYKGLHYTAMYAAFYSITTLHWCHICCMLYVLSTSYIKNFCIAMFVIYELRSVVCYGKVYIMYYTFPLQDRWMNHKQIQRRKAYVLRTVVVPFNVVPVC